MSKEEAIRYWQKTAKKNIKTSSDFFKSKHYEWRLFLGHLALEKIIKGLVVAKSGKNPLPIHDLARLSKDAQIKLNLQQISQLKEINRFNLETRYDDYKLNFYKQANKQFSSRWLKVINQLFLWFKNQY